MTLRSFQIHLSTAITLMLLASALLLVEIVFFATIKSAVERAVATYTHSDAVMVDRSALIFLFVIIDIALLGFTAAVVESAIRRRER